MDFVDEFYVEKDLSILKKLTVVIPTYNRNYYLSRCLWYHSHFPFGEIIVADSSLEDKKVVNRETVRKLAEERGVKIRYLEYPPETERYGGDIVRKWGDAVQHVETKYSQICTDKEFLIPLTLCKFISFLEENVDYDIAAGQRYDMNSSKSKEIALFEAFSGRSSLDYSDPLARLVAISISKSDSFNISSLRRSQVLKYTYDKLFESGIDDLRFGEFGVELLSVILSKSIYFPRDPHICRDSTQLTISFRKWKRLSSESSTLRYPLLDDYVHNGLYADYMDRLSYCLAHEYMSSSCSPILTFQDAKKLMEILLIHLQKTRSFFENPHIKIFRLGRLVLTHLPARVSLYIRRALNLPEYTRIADISDEVRIIIQTHAKTSDLHKKDRPLPVKIR
jgi:glycosyltransferase domain-containing protein